MKLVKRAAIVVLVFPALLFAQQSNSSKAADLYQSALNDLTGGALTRDPIEAVDKLRESARMGYAPAQTAMIFYAETDQEAASFCKKAAEQGDVLGEWCIGRDYFLGTGVMRDWSAAETWLRKSADQGNPFAAYMIGLIKEDRDPKSAPQWFQKAAEQGLPQAQQKLGLLLSEGRSIAIDKYHGYVWLLVSVESGAPQSSEISSLEADLGTTAVNKAKAEARELARTTSRSVVAHGCAGWDGEFANIPTLPPLDMKKYCR